MNRSPCKGCWWEEGALCYLEPVEKTPDGRSTTPAIERCLSFESKRTVLEQFIPSEMLYIVSEHTDK